ncbi:MAG: aldo/keto reductase [Alphaproteobacteria bacterium]
MAHFLTRSVGRAVDERSFCIPTLGVGGAPLGGLFTAVDDSEARLTLSAAYGHGIRYFDTAPFYGFGLSERRFGDVLRGFGGRDYVLSTKVGRLLESGAVADAVSQSWPAALPFHQVYDYGYDGIMRSFEDSLQRLGLDGVDILFVHDIGEMTHGQDNRRHFRALAEGGYKALESLRSSGVVRAIGLGVNEIEVCVDALGMGSWDVFILAGRYTLLEQGALSELLPACESGGVSIIVGGPFNSGILVGGGTWNYRAAPDDIVERVGRLSRICEGCGVPMAAAALQFPLGHGSVVSVIPGLRDRGELSDTLAWAGYEIPGSFWETLKTEGLLRSDAPTPVGNPFYGER